MTSNRFPKALAATGLAAVLVGCGGGGNEAPRATAPEPMPPATDPISAAKDALASAAQAARDLPATTDAATLLQAWQLVLSKAEDLRAAVNLNDGLATDLTTATNYINTANTNIRTYSERVSDIASYEAIYTGAVAAFNDLPAGATDSQKLERQEAIKAAAENLRTALREKGGSSDRLTMIDNAIAAADSHVKALTLSIADVALTDALNGLDGTNPTARQVRAARDAATKLQNAIAHLPDSEKAGYQGRINDANNRITIAQGQIETNEENQANQAVAAAAARWDAAIKRYSVGTHGDLDNDLMGTSRLRVGARGTNVNIALQDNNGIPLTSTAARAPGDMTARRFSAAGDTGVVATSLNARSLRRGYRNYFFQDDGTTPLANADSPVNGVTIAATGVLTFTANTAIFSEDALQGVPRGGLAANADPVEVTFLGVKGRLACGNNACAPQPENNGRFSFSNEATFTPTGNLDDLIVTIQETDDHVVFGYWMDRTGSGSGTRFTVDTFAMAEGHGGALGIEAIGNTDNIVGDVRFSGGAAGIYVLRENDTLTGQGEFTANVGLTAQFGDDTGRVPNAEQWRITGNINEFSSVTDDTHNLGGWNLGLSADFGNRDPETNTIAADARTYRLQDAKTKGSGPDGNWQAAFSGTATAVEATTIDVQAVVGEFDGHFTNGSVVGAFGATRD